MTPSATTAYGCQPVSSSGEAAVGEPLAAHPGQRVLDAVQQPGGRGQQHRARAEPRTLGVRREQQGQPDHDADDQPLPHRVGRAPPPCGWPADDERRHTARQQDEARPALAAQWLPGLAGGRARARTAGSSPAAAPPARSRPAPARSRPAPCRPPSARCRPASAAPSPGRAAAGRRGSRSAGHAEPRSAGARSRSPDSRRRSGRAPELEPTRGVPRSSGRVHGCVGADCTGRLHPARPYVMPSSGAEAAHAMAYVTKGQTEKSAAASRLSRLPLDHNCLTGDAS